MDPRRCVERHRTFFVVLVQSLVLDVHLVPPVLGGVQAAAEFLARQLALDASPEHDQHEEEQESVQSVDDVEEDPDEDADEFIQKLLNRATAPPSYHTT